MSTESTKKTVIVFGATGKQGGSVIKSILGDPKAAEAFHIKGITRDVKKDSAKALAKQGVEPVEANLDDKASLKRAIKGAYAVFAVTNYWEKMNSDVEFQQGKDVADICKEEGVKHLVWSSLLDIKKLSKGVLDKVYHFDAKARVEEYIRSLEIPATFMLCGFFMTNIPGAALRENPESHTYSLSLPMPADAPIPVFSADDDSGKFIKAILLNREKVLGKQIYAATDYNTPEQLVRGFQEVFPNAGKGAKFERMPDDVFKSVMGQSGMPELVQEEMLQNMRLMKEFGYYGGASLDFSHSILDESLTTWKDFIAKTPAFAGLD